MDYDKIYNNLINHASIRGNIVGYFEKHHIIPKCIGGTDDPSNIVKLTAKEHFVAHHLLCKINDGNYKLSSAFNLMCANPHTNKGKGRYVSANRYAIAKRLFSINNPMKDPSVVMKQKDNRRIKKEQNPDWKRVTSEIGLELRRRKNYERGKIKWTDYHNKQGNLHVDGFPLCRCCGNIIIRKSGRRDSLNCSYTCSNNYRCGKINKMLVENPLEMIKKQKEYLNGLSMIELEKLKSEW